MRNLRNIRCDRRATSADITGITWDAGSDEVLITHGPTEAEPRIELWRLRGAGTTSDLNQQLVASWDAPSPSPDLTVDKIVDVHHFSDNATTCIVLAGGDIVVVQEDDHGSSRSGNEAHIEIVGSIDAGIRAARWSPDEDLLVLVSVQDAVVFMSRTFDGVAEASLSVEDLQMSKHVSVGWGKKETQFQGKGAKAKALRDPTIPEKVDEGVPSPFEDNKTTISWRGDGAYLAINTVVGDTRRAIRVYSREGVLDSASEPVDGLESALSWRPAGNLLAGIQRFSDHADVVFFERNGLRHGQFTIRLPGQESIPDKVVLEWNSDSSVLAVSLANRIQLWTTGNYHWYLKQEIFLPETSSSVVWHPEKPLRLGAYSPRHVDVDEYIFTVARGSCKPPHDYGAVAVIDGQCLKVTPLRTANIPPPMAMFELTVASSIVDVAFTHDHSKLAALHHSGVDVFSWETKGSRPIVPKLLERRTFVSTGVRQSEQSVLQISFSGDNEVFVVSADEHTSISESSSEKTSAAALTWHIISEPAVVITSGADRKLAVGQDRTGKLFHPSREENEVLSAKFPSFLPLFEVVGLLDERYLAFGLSRNGQLYSNSRMIAKNCTSFLVTPDHLVFTTNNHLVKFVHLAAAGELEVPPDDPEADERCRSIERGARLVTAIPSTMALVLQMPRGNLETIYPRAMVVAGIRQLVDQKDYGKAFAVCRTQRVDMNVLYDHQPAQFFENVGLFLDQLQDASYIDLFLSSLKEEDVTQTMYKDSKRARTEEIPPYPAAASDQTSKVNSICDAVLQTLRLKKNANLQNIITANVCRKPPAIDDALRVVVELMQEDEGLAERAVEHICFLVDVNRVYDHALGLYNLDLALLVAQQSQRDPREYLPFIQNLHQMPEIRRKFTIDDELGRREKALAHLQSLGSFDELKSYTTKHTLYDAALRLYRYQEQPLRALTDLYAAYLVSISQHREAGLAYESLGDFAKATACYRAVGATSWRECLFAAQQQEPPLSADALGDLAGTLAEALYEAKDYASAATIQAEHLGSLDAAVRSLCKGYLFADALRLIALKKRPDLLESGVDAGLTEALSSSTEFLADCKAQLKAQVPRVFELRRKAIEDPLGFYEGERPHGADGGDIPDDVSIAASSRLSTSASLFTRYTGKGGSVGTVGSNVSRATSKNRRREEKKRARGRKGTVYEEEYLVNSIRRLVDRVESTKGEVERLVFGLVRRSMVERARAVESLMAEVVTACRAAVKEVWPDTSSTVEGQKDSGIGRESDTYNPTGGAAVLQEGLEARDARQEPPIITDFAKLTLLAS